MVESHLDGEGGVVFWTLAEWSTRGRLAAHRAPLGLEAGGSPLPTCASRYRYK